jgi:hypothetical protein
MIAIISLVIPIMVSVICVLANAAIITIFMIIAMLNMAAIPYFSTISLAV